MLSLRLVEQRESYHDHSECVLCSFMLCDSVTNFCFPYCVVTVETWRLTLNIIPFYKHNQLVANLITVATFTDM